MGRTTNGARPAMGPSNPVRMTFKYIRFFDYLTQHGLVMNTYLKCIIKTIHVVNVMCTMVTVYK